MVTERKGQYEREGRTSVRTRYGSYSWVKGHRIGQAVESSEALTSDHFPVGRVYGEREHLVDELSEGA